MGLRSLLMSLQPQLTSRKRCRVRFREFLDMQVGVYSCDNHDSEHADHFVDPERDTSDR